MARSLADFQREYDALRRLINAGGQRMESLEQNLSEYGQQMKAGSTELALRLKELARAGVAHTSIEPYLSDRVVARYIKELGDTREMAKYAATEARELGETFSDLVERGRALQASLRQEIAARQGKRSSRTLRINQSVNRMPALLAQVDELLDLGNPNYRSVASFMGVQSPAQFERLYRDLVNEALTASAKTLKASDARSRRLHSLSYKIAHSVLNKTRVVYQELQLASQQAKRAVTQRSLEALNAAKKKAKLAHLKSKPLTESYAKALKDAELMRAVDEWKDGAKARAAVTAVAKYEALIKKELAEIIALKINR
jgi:hypothetical protein